MVTPSPPGLRASHKENHQISDFHKPQGASLSPTQERPRAGATQHSHMWPLPHLLDEEMRDGPWEALSEDAAQPPVWPARGLPTQTTLCTMTVTLHSAGELGRRPPPSSPWAFPACPFVASPSLRSTACSRLSPHWVCHHSPFPPRRKCPSSLWIPSPDSGLSVPLPLS